MPSSLSSKIETIDLTRGVGVKPRGLLTNAQEAKGDALKNEADTLDSRLIKSQPSDCQIDAVALAVALGPEPRAQSRPRQP